MGPPAVSPSGLTTPTFWTVSIQLAWRFLLFQKDSDLVQWFRSRTEGAKGARKTKMIVALARKLLIALWRMVTTGEIPRGVVLRQAV